MRGGPGGAETDDARQWYHFLVTPCRRPKVRRSRRQHSEVSSSHPRVPPFGQTPVPAFHSCPSYSGGLSRVRPPSSNREVGTLSDSSLEPSLSAPRAGPSTRTVWLGSRTWVWCLPARSLRERTRPSTFPLLVVGRSHPSLRPMRSLASERRPFDDRAFDLYGRLCRQGLLNEGSHNRC